MWRRVSLGVFVGKLFAHIGSPVVSFFPFYLGVSLLKLNSRKKGTLIFKGLPGNLEVQYSLELQGGVARVWVGEASLWV